MRTRFAALLLLVGLTLGAGYFLLYRPARPGRDFNRHLTSGAGTERPTAPTRPKPFALPKAEPGPTLAETLTNDLDFESEPKPEVVPPEEITPASALEQTRMAVCLYASMFGENPTGLNLEITRTLQGYNPRHLNFIRPEAGMLLNEKGELVDLWGTPYFFHHLSPTQMEIRSAGPDRAMWTGDDLLTR